MPNIRTINVHIIDMKTDLKWLVSSLPPSQPSPRGEGVAKHFPLGGKRKGVQNKKEEFNFLQLHIHFM